MKLLSTPHIKGDVFGGITAGIVALPLALAFGIQAFGNISINDVGNIGAIGALAGLVTAIMLGFFGSLFGGRGSYRFAAYRNHCRQYYQEETQQQSGLYAMETAIKSLQSKGITVLMTIIQPQPLYMLKSLKVIPDILPEENTFKSFEEYTAFLKGVVG